MKINKLIFYCLPVAFIVVTAFNFKPAKDADKRKDNRPAADTTSFASNTGGGWSILSCYFNQSTPDSMQFELLLKQNNALDFRVEQFIGTISNAAFRPVQAQNNLLFNLLFNSRWRVRVLPNGRCFLRLTQGIMPPGSPVFFPLKVKYKKN